MEFFYSNFFIGLSTLVVGLAAYIVYRLQKRDQKKDTANIILLEIQNAERVLKRIKESLAKDILPSDLRAMQSENWSKYKYLFVRDFDRDEWDSVTDFYNKCQLLDESINYNNAAFWSDVEQIRANKQRILAEYSKESAGHNDEATFIKNTDEFDELYMSRQMRFSYSPQRVIDDAKIYVNGVNIDLSQSRVGTKLKKIAKIS